MHEKSNQDCHDLYERLLCSWAIHVEKQVEPEFCDAIAGEITLPKGFAENSATVIATAGLPKCLLLLEESHWCTITTELLNRTRTGAQSGVSAAESLRHLFLGNAAELDISPRRTVELPNHLLDYAGIDQRLTQSRHGQAIELLPAGDAKFL